MKKLLIMFAILFASSSFASDMDLVSGMYSDEDGKPVRIQHVMRHRLGTDWLSLRGINNLDLDSDGNWQRIQLKPRLLVRYGFVHFVNQFEYFETRTFDRKSNRVGVGVGYGSKTFSFEVNYLATDSLTDNARWDSYLNLQTGKWSFNNILWYVPKTDQRLWQPGVSYHFTERFRLQAQHRMLTGQEDVMLIGLGWRF
jgi:hypothetical protein